jgi:hypothetical protein
MEYRSDDEEDDIEIEEEEASGDEEFELDDDEVREEEREESRFDRASDRKEQGRATTWYPDTRPSVYANSKNSTGGIDCGRCNQPISLDAQGRESGNTGGLKRRQQPPLGHVIDHVLLREGIDQGAVSDMSDTERDEFEVFADNNVGNLRPEHFNCNAKAPKLHADDYSGKNKGRADSFLRAQRPAFKADKRAQDRRKKKHKKKLNFAPLSLTPTTKPPPPPPPSGGGMGMPVMV